MITKFLSRKFLVAVATLVVAITMVLNPSADEATVQTASNNVVEGLLLITPSIYIVMQGLIDKKDK